MCAESSLSSAMPVERPDEREERHPEPEREERDPIPAGEIGASATPQPHDGLQEQERRDSGRNDRSHAVDCASDRPGYRLRNDEPRASVT